MYFKHGIEHFWMYCWRVNWYNLATSDWSHRANVTCISRMHTRTHTYTRAFVSRRFWIELDIKRTGCRWFSTGVEEGSVFKAKVARPRPWDTCPRCTRVIAWSWVCVPFYIPTCARVAHRKYMVMQRTMLLRCNGLMQCRRPTMGTIRRCIIFNLWKWSYWLPIWGLV